MAMKMIIGVSLLLAVARAAKFTRLKKQRSDWVLSEQKATSHDETELVFAVKQNTEVLGKLFWERNDPDSPRYRDWLDSSAVAALVSNPDASTAVVSALASIGARLTKVTLHGDYIRAIAPISVWNSFLDADFQRYEHHERAGTAKPAVTEILRTQEYSIPVHLEDALLFVGLTVNFPPALPKAMVPKLVTDERILKQYKNQSIVEGCTTPQLLNEFYNIESNTGSATASQSVFEIGQYYSPNDLASFQRYFDLPVQEVACDKSNGDWVSDRRCQITPNACTEANLDVQYMMAVAQDVPTTYWAMENQFSQTPFLDFAQQVLDDPSPPLVHSISYGSIESEMDPDTMASFDTAVQRLGVQGISVFVSSGDDGVANFQCACDSYEPSYPATSPYVVAVGATQGPETATEEIACASNTYGLITTGGGFSTYYAQPSYQSDAVDNYFKVADDPKGEGYVASGRGYPDISMAGHNYLVAVGGSLYIVSGTSASSPVVAAMASLVNSKLAKSGRRPGLGFINMALYSSPSSFNDITSGSNDCCAGCLECGPVTCCDEAGFYAAEGWDPLTGVGSVDYAKFEELLLGEDV